MTYTHTHTAPSASHIWVCSAHDSDEDGDALHLTNDFGSSINAATALRHRLITEGGMTPDT